MTTLILQKQQLVFVQILLQLRGKVDKIPLICVEPSLGSIVSNLFHSPLVALLGKLNLQNYAKPSYTENILDEKTAI